MFVENPPMADEWADEAPWLVERDRLTGRAVRAWSHVEWRTLLLLENFTPHPRFDFAGQLWAGSTDFPAKLDMLVRLAHGHLPEGELDELHRLMTEVRSHHAKAATIAHHRVRRAYFVEDCHDRAFVDAESAELAGWIAALDRLAGELQDFTVRNTFRKGQLAYAHRRDEDYRGRYGAPAEWAPALYGPPQIAAPRAEAGAAPEPAAPPAAESAPAVPQLVLVQSEETEPEPREPEPREPEPREPEPAEVEPVEAPDGVEPETVRIEPLDAPVSDPADAEAPLAAAAEAPAGEAVLAEGPAPVVAAEIVEIGLAAAEDAAAEEEAFMPTLQGVLEAEAARVASAG